MSARCKLILLGTLLALGPLEAGDIRVDGKIISTEPSAPPIEVTSTAKVENLNADLLDGLSSSDFVAAGDLRQQMEFVSCLSPLELVEIGEFESILPLFSSNATGGTAGVAWDTQLTMVSATADETTVSLFLYDASGVPLEGQSFEVCNPCQWIVGGEFDPASITVRIGDLLDQAGSPLNQPAEGFGVLEVAGISHDQFAAAAFIRYGGPSSPCPGS